MSLERVVKIRIAKYCYSKMFKILLVHLSLERKVYFVYERKENRSIKDYFYCLSHKLHQRLNEISKMKSNEFKVEKKKSICLNLT